MTLKDAVAALGADVAQLQGSILGPVPLVQQTAADFAALQTVVNGVVQAANEAGVPGVTETDIPMVVE